MFPFFPPTFSAAYSAVHWPKNTRLSGVTFSAAYSAVHAGWIVHRCRAKAGLAGTDMMFRPIAIAVLLKRFGWSDWSEFLDGYGMPMRLGKYPAGASDDEQRRLMWGLNQLGRHGYGVVPDGMSIELVNAVQSGAGDAFERLVMYCDKCVSRVLHAGTLTSSADGGTKTNALGKIHSESRHKLVVDYAHGLAETLTWQLLWPAAQLNRGVVARSRMPRLVFDTRKPADLAMYATALPALVVSQLPIRQFTRSRSSSA